MLPSPSRLFPACTALLLLGALAGCTTIQNRRDLYFPQTTEGPYTRMLQHRLSVPAGTPAKPVDGKNVIKPQG